MIKYSTIDKNVDCIFNDFAANNLEEIYNLNVSYSGKHFMQYSLLDFSLLLSDIFMEIVPLNFQQCLFFVFFTTTQ